MKGPHTSTWKGKRVRVVLKGGEVLVGKFVSKQSKYIVIDCGEMTKIRKNELVSFAHYRPQI